MTMPATQDHRSYQEALMAGRATRATGAKAVPMSAPAGPCGPVAPQPNSAPLNSNLHVTINGTHIAVSSDKLGAGPSNAPPCPDPNTHVYMHNAWHKVHTQTPAEARCLPRPRPRPRPSPSPHSHTSTPQGLSALLFGPNYVVATHNGGAPLRMLLATACRKAVLASGGETTAMAFAALSMGRIQWLGNPTLAAANKGTPIPPTRIRLAAIPTAYKQALLNYRQPVEGFVREFLGWRMVLCENGDKLPVTLASRVPRNRFAPLMHAVAATEPTAFGSVATAASTLADDTAAQPDLSLLTGTVVCKPFHGKPYYGVATYTSAQEQPFVFSIRYTDGDHETMTCQELQQHKVNTWARVPKRLHKSLKRIGGKMSVAQLPAAPLNAHHNAIIRKRFGGRWYYGVATFMAGETAPYVYSIMYEDGDTETMTLSTVQKHVVHSFASIPAALHARLVALGGRAAGQPTLTTIQHSTGEQQQGQQQGMQRQQQQQPQQGQQQQSQRQQRYTLAGLWLLVCYTLLQIVRGVLDVCGGILRWAAGMLCAPQHTAAQVAASAPLMQETEQHAAEQQQQQQQQQHQRRQQRTANRRRRRRAAGRTRMANLSWCSTGLRVGYINVCGLTQLKAAELQGIIRSLDLDIIAVAETWEGRCHTCTIPGYVFVSKPRQGGEGGGVGFYVSSTISPLVTAHVNTQVPEAIWLELASRRRGAKPVFLGVVYLPPSSLTNSTNIETTYTLLHTDISTFQQKGDVIVLGDFNSRVGKANQPLGHIGQWGVDENADAAGTALKHLLQETDMYALNGRSPNPSPEQHTPAYTRSRLITRQDGTIETQNAVLDYILAPKHWALPQNNNSPVCNLHVEQQRQLTGTDHLLMWCVVPHPVSKQRTPQPTQQRANIHLLTTPGPDRAQHQNDYQAAIAGQMQGYTEMVVNLQQQVEAGHLDAAAATEQAKEELTTRIHTAVNNSIGYRAPPGPQGSAKRPPIYTREVRMAVREKDAANMNLITARTAASADPSNNAALQAAQETYLTAQRAVKSAVASARNEITEKNVEAVFECESRNDAKGMWKGLQRLAGKHANSSSGPKALKGPHGTLVMGDKQIADILATQYERATNPESFAENASFDEHHKVTIEGAVSTFRTSTSYTNTGANAMSAPIIAAEVEAQCSRLHNWKSPSPLDDVYNELLKYAGEPLTQALTTLFQMQFHLETKAQTPGVIKALYKRDDPTIAANYRPITLGSTIDKLYNMVLNARICGFLESNKGLHDAQQGFRPGRSGLDNIFMLTQCLSARMKQNLTTYLLFVDIEKAYDSVWRPGLLWHLWHKGIRGKLFRVLAQMTDSPTSIVLHNGAFSSPFQPGMGWEQGDTLATTMFNIYVDSVLKEVWENHQGVPLPSSNTTSTTLTLVALMYADDMVGLANSHETMQSLIDATRAALTRWRLKASVKSADGSKTAVMVVRGGTAAARQRAGRQGPAPADPFMWGNITVPQVRSYRYLGVWISDVGTWEEHMRIRKEKAEAATHAQRSVLHQNRMSWHLRKLTVSAAVQPVLTYAVQVWGNTTLTTRKFLDSWQMQLVKRINHCPPNSQTECLQQELGIMPAHITCDIFTLTYWHHLRRLSSDRLLRQVAEAWTNNLNPWQQNIDKLLAEYDIDTAATTTFTKGQFAAYVKSKAARRLQQLWSTGPRATSTTLQNYTTAFGPGVVKQNKPAARAYVTKLSQIRRGLAAELCMKMRLECLPLRAIHSCQRRNETNVQRAQRESCPMCHNAPETLAHFLLECPAYSACRTTLFTKLQETVPAALAAIQAGPPANAWRVLLADDILSNDVPARPAGAEHEDGSVITAMTAVANFVCEIWKLRSTVLTGRGTNEGDLMV